MKKLEKMLWEGIHGNDLRKVALALNLGADVNTKEKSGMSPLHRARSVTIAELLISAGAKVNAEDDEDGWSPLAVAAYYDNVALAEYLISAGADVNSKDKWGQSPLHWVVSLGNKAPAELLISAGAKVNAKDKWGESPLYEAVLRGNKEMQDLLKQHGAK